MIIFKNKYNIICCLSYNINYCRLTSYLKKFIKLVIKNTIIKTIERVKTSQ